MNSSRRSFLKGSLFAGTASLITSRILAAPRASVVVIGAGAFGGWSALQLQQNGAKVTLLDSWGPGNSRASSGGETRIIRGTYGAQKMYTQMAARALQLWQENEQRWNVKLFFKSGVLWMAGTEDSYERASLPLLKDAGIPFERLSIADCAKRWPQVNFEGISWSIYEPDSGYLAARRGCEAVLNAFLKAGGEYRQVEATPGTVAGGRMQGVKISTGEMLHADEYVFCCGPWLGKVFPFLNTIITPSRQEVFFFGTEAGDLRFTDAELPVWIDGGKNLFYGIPGNHWRGFKVANDARGPAVDPTTMERQISSEGLAAARRFVSHRFPAMSSAPLLESRVCQYENSPDQNFILDRHPEAENAWVVGGGSGHGFKHGPAMGEMVANAALGRKAPPDEMSLSRLLKKSAANGPFNSCSDEPKS
jgi:glycine/D-amino acid oxidase-like deaminating enzyme